MPVVPPHNYPGVYIQEVPSSVHTIVGVSTSITAFLGRAPRGPVNEPTMINNYADFESTFGGLGTKGPLAYAVEDFYLNGGSQAIIVRLYNATSSASTPAPQTTVTPVQTPQAGSTPAGGTQSSSTSPGTPGSTPQSSSPASPGAQNTSVTTTGSSPQAPAPPAAAPITNARLKAGGLPLEAKDPGVWGNNLCARVDPADVKQKDAQSRFGVSYDDLFNLSVHDTETNALEVFRNVSVSPQAPQSQQVDRVLKNSSSLVRVPDDAPRPLTKPTHSGLPAANSNTSIWDPSLCTVVADKVADANDVELTKDAFIADGLQAKKEGLYALEHVDLFNLLCIPPYANGDVDLDLISKAAVYCEKRRAMLLVDPPSTWTTKQAVVKAFNPDPNDQNAVEGVGITSANAMLFFPRLRRFGDLDDYAPAGAIAGVIARTDAQRGVWKAPAGTAATLNGVARFSVPLTDDENGELNPLGVNCLRTFPGYGPVIWGARTLQGDDRLASQWKYIPVRRMALYIEESLYRGIKWAVFEPNDEPLWSQLRLNIGVFMHGLFRQGAFQGQKPSDAYFVQCDSTTTAQADIDQGIVNIYVGFAPLKPAEFVILYLQQMAGQLAV